MDSICNIAIYDKTFNPLGVTALAESVLFQRELFSTGSFQIVIHPDKKFAKELAAKGNIVVINRNGYKSGIIRDIALEEKRDGAAYTILGATGNVMLSNRIAVPPPGGDGYDSVTAAAETVIKYYVNQNLVNPSDPARRIPNLAIGPDKQRGVSLAVKLRYNNLSEALGSVAQYTELGYQTYADVINKRWMFDVVPGADRTKGQTANDPVFFMVEQSNAEGNIDNYKYTENYRNFANAGYAGGTGDNAARAIQVIGNAAGIDRIEQFFDCGNVTGTDLTDAGTLALSNCTVDKSVDALALPRVFIFEKDYFIGDRVSVYLRRLGMTLNSQITSVTEVWERQNGYQVQVRFGLRKPIVFTLNTNTSGVR